MLELTTLLKRQIVHLMKCPIYLPLKTQSRVFSYYPGCVLGPFSPRDAITLVKNH
ncbi:hypothetical protein I3760_14G133100 [Carya illinoinensis]|nr:hypothetical protein I3760_14G133100 [Carya illinoinensis]